MSENYEELIAELCDKTRVFDEEEVEEAVSEFNKLCSSSGTISSFESFTTVFTKLFEDPSDENASQILENEEFMKRVYRVMTEDGELTLPRFLENVTHMFSNDDLHFLFKFKLYDSDNNGKVTEQEVYDLVFSFFSTMINSIRKQKGTNIEVDEALASEKLRGVISHYFAIADSDNTSYLDYPQFKAAMEKDDDCFDWGFLASEALEQLEDSLQQSD
eukprot:CAMPEP_0174263302 /NCGR_PEP_ID=MMETSP0439-20130205/18078_1 /TAXON_ID=0 /ORGANISM="Stereomyxa ramosa, Strain Chinc5" /LENGTH=216 /DNA_ID=CAMNT_0015348585 /DNA_START=32 /DNA_END=682 /DNA_ORIENTATION=+